MRIDSNRIHEYYSLAFADQNAQLAETNQNITLILEQLKVSKQKIFGRPSEKIVYEGQLEMLFNEAEVTIVNKYVVELEID